MSRRPKAPSPVKAAATVMRAFLFSDLRDYTAFVERQGDAAAARLLREYRAIVRGEIARHRGAEVKTEGDSFYVVFEQPSVAVACAVAIQRRAEARNAAGAEAPLRVGMGLHAGEVVPHDDQYVGSAVNVASRLAGKAAAGEIVISDTVRGLVRTSIDQPLSERGPLKLKGVSERVRAWRVDWGAAATAVAPTTQGAPQVTPAAIVPPVVARPAFRPTGQLLCPSLVDRDHELAEIDTLLERAVSGGGSTLIVGGDAGVGKTALLRESQSRAVAGGFRILVGSTHESTAGPPYGPFVDALRSAFRGLEHERLARFVQRTAPGAAQLFPEIRPAGVRRTEGSDAEHHALSVGFREMFRAFARDGPLLVIVEDLHWADEASLDLLQDLARELRDAPILLLATYRSDEMHRRHPFLRSLAALQRERLATVVRLRPLTKQRLGELIRLTFAREHPVSAEFLAAIYSRSEGNPYFTEELLKVLVESGEVTFDRERAEWTRGAKPVDEMRIPDSIVDAVRARVDRSSAGARLTLGTAAVIGLRIPFDALRAVRQLPEEDLEAHLRELIEQQLLAEHGRDEDAYAFRHALTREVVYDDLLVSERKRLHRATADALGAAAMPEPALLAHHLIAAGETARAVPYVLEAGDHALAAGAPRDSVAHYERALTIGVGDDQRQSVLEHVAEAYLRFDGAKAVPVAEEAAAQARSRGDRRALSRALGLAAAGESEGAKSEALMLESIEVLSGEECVELARAKAQLANRRAMGGHVAEAIALADEVSALGERLGDRYSVGQGLAIKAVLLMGADRHREAVAVNLRARDMLLEAGHPGAALGRQSNVVFSMMFLGTPVDEMERAIAEGFAIAAKHGVEIPANLAHFQAGLLINRGEWDEALEQLSRTSPGQRASVEAQVALGRSGPEASLPHRLTASDASIRSGIGYVVLGALIQRAVAFDRVGDTDKATEAIERLRGQLAKEPALAVAVGIGMSSANLVALAVRHEQPEWLDRITAAADTAPNADGADGAWGRLKRFARLAVAAGRALLADDAASCAAEVTRYYDATSATEESGAVSFAIGMARAARHRELTLGPEWRPLFERCRTFAERAKAAWWLSEIDALEATID